MVFKRVLLLIITLSMVFSCKTQSSRTGSPESATASGTEGSGDATAQENQTYIQPSRVEKILVISDKKGLGLEKSQVDQLVMGTALSTVVVASLAGLFMLRGGKKVVVDEPVMRESRVEVSSPGKSIDTASERPSASPRVDTEARIESPITVLNPTKPKKEAGGAEVYELKIEGSNSTLKIEEIATTDLEKMIPNTAQKSNLIISPTDANKLETVFESFAPDGKRLGAKFSPDRYGFERNGKHYVVEKVTFPEDAVYVTRATKLNDVPTSDKFYFMPDHTYTRFFRETQKLIVKKVTTKELDTGGYEAKVDVYDGSSVTYVMSSPETFYIGGNNVIYKKFVKPVLKE